MQRLIESYRRWRLESAKEIIRRSGASVIMNCDFVDAKVTQVRERGRAVVSPADMSAEEILDRYPWAGKAVDR